MYEIRAFMCDLARGMRGDVTYLTNIIERFPKYGYNMLIINIECLVQKTINRSG